MSKKKVKQKNIICVPAYLHPRQRITFSSCTFVPGAKIMRLVGLLKKRINEFAEKIPNYHPGFSFTHVFCIDEQIYLDFLKKRLQGEGLSIPHIRILDTYPIIMQGVISMMLQGRISFAFQGQYDFKVQISGRNIKYCASGMSNLPLYELSKPMYALLMDTGHWSALDGRKIKQISMKLDRYFRSGIWWTDRLGMALRYFWIAMCTPFSEQSFLSLTTLLESLLTTQPMEITHNLAERCAIVLGNDRDSRVDVYNKVKEIYRIRSIGFSEPATAQDAEELAPVSSTLYTR